MKPTSISTPQAASACELLNRPIPTDHWEEWTRRIAEPEKQLLPSPDSMLVFQVETEWLGLPTLLFQEVVESRVVHSIPHHQHKFLLGLVNIRGRLVMCMSLANLLGVSPNPPTTPGKNALIVPRLLVLKWENTAIACPVTQVFGIQKYNQATLLPLPQTLAGTQHRFTRGLFAWNEKSVGCLDEQLLFHALKQGLT